MLIATGNYPEPPPEDLTGNLRRSLRDAMTLVANKAATVARCRASIDLLAFIDAQAYSCRDLALLEWAADLGRREGLEARR